MSPRKKKPVQVPPPAEAAPEAAAPVTGAAPEGAARVEVAEPPAAMVEPEAAPDASAPGEGLASGEVVEPEAWAKETAEEEDFSFQDEEEAPAGGVVIEAIEPPEAGAFAPAAEGTAPDHEAEPAGGEEPRADEPRIETIEAPAQAADSPGLEASDEVEEAEGEVLDTELGRVLSTPTGLRSAIEALLFVTPEPLTPHRIARALEMNDTKIVMSTLTQLKSDYDDQKRGFQIIETAEGFQMASREVFGDLILRLKNRKRRPSLSQAALETLAIVAYRQPIIRAEVEAVRGVESSGTIRNLIDMGMVEMVGRKEVLGRPPMYGTTEQFLQSFGLRNLADLPAIGELKRRLTENENKPAEVAKPEPPAAAAAAMAAAAEAENPFQGDLPGQMYIEVPGGSAPETNQADAPDGHEGNGADISPQSQNIQLSEDDDEGAEPEEATLAASADAPVPDGNEAAPDRKMETAGGPGLEGDTMSDREKWEAEEEDELEEELEDDEDVEYDDEDEDEDEDEDDAEYAEDEEDEDEELDEDDEEEDDEDEDEDEEFDDEEDEDDEEELEDEEDEEDYEDEDEDEEEDEDEDEGPRQKKR